MNTGIGGVLNGRKHEHFAYDPWPLRSDLRGSQLSRDVEGSSRPLSGMQKSRSLNGDAGVSTWEPGKLG